MKVAPKWKWKPKKKVGPLTFNGSNGRLTSVTFKLWRFRWNSRTRVLGWDNPGPGTMDLVKDVGPRIGAQAK